MGEECKYEYTTNNEEMVLAVGDDLHDQNEERKRILWVIRRFLRLFDFKSQIEVIDDVSTQKSEIGILYLSNFNKNMILKMLNSADLEFHHLINCQNYVYIYKDHPLAKKEIITFDDLKDYPNLSFEQGDNSSFYFSEEIYANKEYQRMVKVNDRATMLNMMRGLYGFTLCSGIICQELNGDDYIAVPFKPDEDDVDDNMSIGYIIKKNQILSRMGSLYIEEIKNYFKKYNLL